MVSIPYRVTTTILMEVTVVLLPQSNGDPPSLSELKGDLKENMVRQTINLSVIVSHSLLPFFPTVIPSGTGRVNSSQGLDGIEV